MKSRFSTPQGYCNPYIGACKASVYKASGEEVKKIQNGEGGAQEAVARKAYDTASPGGNKIESDFYKAKDEEGKEVVFQLHISAIAGKKTVYTISEVRDYHTVV